MCQTFVQCLVYLGYELLITIFYQNFLRNVLFMSSYFPTVSAPCIIGCLHRANPEDKQCPWIFRWFPMCRFFIFAPNVLQSYTVTLSCKQSVRHSTKVIVSDKTESLALGSFILILYNKMCIIIYFLPISSHKMCEASAEHILWH